MEKYCVNTLKNMLAFPFDVIAVICCFKYFAEHLLCMRA